MNREQDNLGRSLEPSIEDRLTHEFWQDPEGTPFDRFVRPEIVRERGHIKEK